MTFKSISILIASLFSMISCGSSYEIKSAALSTEEENPLLKNMQTGYFENGDFFSWKTCSVEINLRYEDDDYNVYKVIYKQDVTLERSYEFQTNTRNESYVGNIQSLYKFASNNLLDEIADFESSQGSYSGYYVKNSKSYANTADIFGSLPILDLFVSKKGDINIDTYLFFDNDFSPKKLVKMVGVGNEILETEFTCKNLVAI